MATLNSISCDAILKNVGISDCSFNPDVITGLIFIPRGMTFNGAEIADWQNTLVNAANSDSKTNRIFPVGGFIALTDNSEDTVRETPGYGAELFVRDGQYRWQFRFIKGGKCLHTSLRSFRGKQDQFDVLLVDKANAVIGTTTTDPVTGEEMLAGLSLADIDVPKFTLADGSTNTQYWIRITLLDEGELNDRPGIVLEQDAPFGIMRTVRGIIDVKLQNVTPVGAGAGVKSIAMLAGCGSENVVELYADELSDPTLYIATNAQTGGTIPITAANVVGSTVQLTLNAGSPNYPTGTGKIKITLVSPSDLAEAGLESPEGNRYEGGTVLVPAASPTT